jgi:hypothetical protein
MGLVAWLEGLLGDDVVCPLDEGDKHGRAAEVRVVVAEVGFGDEALKFDAGPRRVAGDEGSDVFGLLRGMRAPGGGTRGSEGG